ncbi:expansin EXLX1 family cellulose-binding protein [Cryptosporangium arvum]|uniref:Endoglucanase-like protein n=1 Tax=Cryptosporangium arvum DSM 44712 TaxID=927661 RepID=A0A010YH32_9ACTN|nr:expansin EXLX1 family cellulose-binding protein [Cryptosporangium arvum]EXG79585.1 endoglucanase-like protein [Cryptosporangium arvum DSM 44712]
MTGPRWEDEPIDAWDPADTDFFGAPRSKGGNTGEFRVVDGASADSGRGKHRGSRRRGLGSSAVAGVAGAVAARSAVDRQADQPELDRPVSAGPGFERAGSDRPRGFGSVAGEPRSFRSEPVASSFETADFRAGATAMTEVVPAAKDGGRFAGLRRALRRRWFAPSVTGGVVLCSVAFVTGVTQFAGAACAAVPPAGVERSGEATFFDGGVGNCSFPSLPADDLYVALGPSEYSGAGACGSYLDVKGPSGSVRVKVVDQCPECEEGHIDLSREAFEQIADPEAGVVPITYSAVANPAVGKLSARVKEGSSEFFLSILIDNHGNPLTNVEVDGTDLSRTTDNHWVADGGLGTGPFSVKVTDNAGRTATIPNVTLSPGSVQQSTVALGGGNAVSAPTTKAAAPASSSPASSPAADAPLAAAPRDATGESSAEDSSSSNEQNDTETAVTPDADASEEIAANPAPSSSVAVPRATESAAGSTGRNSCG